MPWTCPACHHPIRHSEHESDPRPGVTYRCHVCRLELVADVEHGRMNLAPWMQDQSAGPDQQSSANEPAPRPRPRNGKLRK